MSEWIPVSERLPEKMKEVLVWSRGGDFAEVAFWEGRRWKKIWDHEVIYTVTNWMPLPEPPKEENK